MTLEKLKSEGRKELDWLVEYEKQFGWSDNYCLDDSQVEFINNLIKNTTAHNARIKAECQKREEVVEAKNNAYHERNLLVQALTRIYPAYLARHDENDESWEKDWMWIVYVDIPVKTKVVSGDQHNNVPESKWFETKEWQVSWHIHDSEKELFDHLEVKENNWDGHSTHEKYERLKALTKTNNPKV